MEDQPNFKHKILQSSKSKIMEGWKSLMDDADPQNYEWKVWLYCSLLAASIPIIIPAVQFGYIFNLWSQYNKPVNRQQCSCSCWDTVFKGNNEWKGHENEWLHKRSSWIKVNLRWEIRNGKQKRKFLYIKFQLITRPEWQATSISTSTVQSTAWSFGLSPF